MKKLLILAGVGLILAGCSGKHAGNGPLGLQSGLTIDEANQIVKLNNHQTLGDIDIFGIEGAVNDHAKGDDYELVFIDKKLTKASADYKGKDNAQKAMEYVKSYAECEDSGIGGVSMCFKKDHATPKGINDLLAHMTFGTDEETGEAITSITYYYR